MYSCHGRGFRNHEPILNSYVDCAAFVGFCEKGVGF